MRVKANACTCIYKLAALKKECMLFMRLLNHFLPECVLCKSAAGRGKVSLNTVPPTPCATQNTHQQREHQLSTYFSFQRGGHLK